MLHQERPDPNKAEYGAGGAEVIVRDIIEGMRARGHVVAWMTRRDEFQLLNEEWDVAHAVTIHNYIGMDIAQVLRAKKVPLVFTLMDYWPFCAPRMCLIGRNSCSAATTVCDGACNIAPPPHEWLDTLNASYVVAMNQYSGDIFSRNGVNVSDVIEPGVDPDVWEPSGERDIEVLTSAGYAPTPETVSKLMPWKGFAVLQEACIGASFGVSVCTGIPRVDLPKILSRGKVYVFPSLYEETFGMTLCEARSSGCVCIASEVAGAKAQITNGEDGLLVQPGDPVSLRNAIEMVLADYPAYAHMGQRARERVIGHNTLQHMLDGYERAYEMARRTQ